MKTSLLLVKFAQALKDLLWSVYCLSSRTADKVRTSTVEKIEAKIEATHVRKKAIAIDYNVKRREARVLLDDAEARATKDVDIKHAKLKDMLRTL